MPVTNPPKLDFLEDPVRETLDDNTRRNESNQLDEGYLSGTYVFETSLPEWKGSSPSDIESDAASTPELVQSLNFTGSTEQFVGGKQKLIPVPSSDPLGENRAC